MTLCLCVLYIDGNVREMILLMFEGQRASICMLLFIVGGTRCSENHQLMYVFYSLNCSESGVCFLVS